MFDRIFNKKSLMIGLVIFLFLTLLALMSFTRFVTNELALGKPGYFKFFFIMETTGVYTYLFIIPFILWFIKKFPIKRKNLHTRIPLHLLASIVFGVCHTLLMYLSRNIIYWLADWGTYNYGRIEYRFLMEYTHQFFVYWLIYGIIFFINTIREKQKQKIRTVQLGQQLTKARLQALQMQLHPHFLFNTLNMISSTMYENAKAADKMIANLSDLLRITLDSKGSEEHTLEKELEIVNLYIEIMKARFQNKLVVKMDIDNKTLDALVPGFILQPLLENSIKFSMENLKSINIKILSKKEDNTLILIIKDNGPGITGNIEQIIRNGVGLSNIVERLEKLYGNNQSFHLQNQSDGGLKVMMEIPFQLVSKEEYSIERH